MRILDTFAGIGGFSLAAHWMGWETAAFIEKAKHPQNNLRKNFPGVPIYDDICTFDYEKERDRIGSIDLVCGGFPCQPFSTAGKQKGRDDDRFLWPELLGVLRSVKPTWFVGENVRNLTKMDDGDILEQIFSDLEGIGYTVQAFLIPASVLGAPHRRERVWIVAYNEGENDRRHQRVPKKRQISEFRNGSEPGSFAYASGDGQQIGKAGEENGNGGNGPGKQKRNKPKSCHGKSGYDGNVPPNAECARLQRRVHGSGQNEQSNRGGETDQFKRSDFPFKNPDQIRCDKLSNEASKQTRVNGYACATNGARNGTNAWTQPWLEAATRLCRMDDGLPDWLDSQQRKDIYEAVEYFGREEAEKILGFDLGGVENQVQRKKRLESLGNAIVPQVACEIFQAIEYESNLNHVLSELPF